MKIFSVLRVSSNKNQISKILSKLSKIFIIIFILIVTAITIFPNESQAVWTERTSAGSRNWQSIATSSDGVKIAAVVDSGYIYTSTNSGATWTERISVGQKLWRSIASSSDGTKLAAVVSGGDIYTSTDSGATWVDRSSAGLRNWQSISSSSDGTILVAASSDSWDNSYIYTSEDAGVNWIQRTGAGSHPWRTTAMSSDGTKMVAAANNEYLYISNNTGATWTRTGLGLMPWISVSSSSDGTKLAAVAGGASTFGAGSYYVYTSEDSGTTWIEQINSTKMTSRFSIASSSDGTKLVTLNSGTSGIGDYIYKSVDSGATWLTQTTAGQRFWKSISSSSDGTKFAAIVYGGYIYTYTPTQLSVISTDAASSTTQISTTLNGTISNVGEENPTVRGFEYGLTTSYGTTTVENGSFGIGSYTKSITGFSCSTLYHFRAYATNSGGKAIGGDQSFTTNPCTYPLLSTSAATSISLTGATLNGNILNIGQDNSTIRGFQYGLTTSYGTTTIENGSFGLGAFTSDIIGLSCGNTYHFRSYATNSISTGYGDDLTFAASNCSSAGWVRRTSSGLNNWYSVAMSADGTKIVASSSNSGNGYIYISTDSGRTWTQKTSAGLKFWYSVAMSADGTKLAAAVYDDYIYTSIDGGDTWIAKTTSTIKKWAKIILSSDGTKIAAWNATDSRLYTSTDSGATWTIQYGANGVGLNMTMSSLGDKIAGSLQNLTYISTSNDGGITWTKQYNSDERSWSGIASSSDGIKMAATNGGYGYSGYVLTSTDGGINWIQRTNAGFREWKDIASSADGNTLVAITKYNYIYLSRDSGNTWAEQTSAGQNSWQYISSSADGTKLAATSASNYIYTYEQANISTLNTNPASSIISNGATLNGYISNTGGEVSSVRGFEYGLDTSYGKTTIENGSFGIGAFTKNISGLSCETTYHFRSYATNGGGSSYGNDQTFISGSCSGIPVLSTEIVSSISPTSVTLNGSITNIGLSNPTVRGFEYGLTTNYSASNIGNGTFAVGLFSKNVSALICGSTYHYRSFATNTTGIGYGQDLTFNTSSCIYPSLTTNTATLVTSITATLNGTISNTGGSNPTVRGFEYGTTISYGTSTVENGTFGIGSYSKNVSGLICATLYHFRSYATNTNGNGVGVDQTFTTGSCSGISTLTTQTATLISLNGATLNGTITNTSGENPTIRGFEYGTTISYGTIANEIGSFGIGSYTKNVTTLTCGTLYHFRAYATNSGGSGYGNDQTFTTGTCSGISTISTEVASSLSSTSATLNGTVLNTGGENPTVRGYEYGVTISYGTTTIENGTFGISSFSKNISSLSCATLYHFRSYATNTIGTGYGNDQTLTTNNCTYPNLTTNNATSIIKTSAVLSGSITDTGGNNSTVRGFEYGLDTSYGTSTTENGTFGLGSYTKSVSGLTCGTLYHFRAYGTNGGGTGYGNDQTFTTGTCSGTIGWTAQYNLGFKYWYTIASSLDGNKLAAGVLGDYIYTSIDSGLNWTAQINSGIKSWISIASSSDGTKLTAAGVSASNGWGYLYTSVDSGATWTERTSAGNRTWNYVASSSDGTKLAASVSNGYIYTSIDSGATWTERTSSGLSSWSSIASSADGIKLVATYYSGLIRTSSDSGATWTAQANAGSLVWRNVTSSTDGTKLAAAAFNGYIYTSIDSGVNWTAQTGSGIHYWKCVYLSPDGTKLIALDNNPGYIYTSIDGGVTWIKDTITGSRAWQSVTSSSDGTKLTALASADYIYTYWEVNMPKPTTDTAVITGVNIVTLNGYVDTDHTIHGFQYGLTTSYGTTTTESGAYNFGNITTNISSITPGITYHFRSYATNSSGTAYSDDNTFVLQFQNWTPNTSASQRSWSSIASSIDGNKLVAVGSNSYIYTSIDGGTTWTERNGAGKRGWKAVASSSDGKKLVVGNGSNGFLYTSTDGGETWTARTSLGLNTWLSIASSSDGTNLAAVTQTNGLYTSNDSGATWIVRPAAGYKYFTSIASSSDGIKLVATVSPGYIYTSIDRGATWVERTGAGSQSWSSVASSSDGTKLAVVSSQAGGSIYTSNDSGANWTLRSNARARYWNTITSSSDGTKLAATENIFSVNLGYIYISNDSGENWVAQASAGKRAWIPIFSSSDGSKILAGDNNYGYLYSYSLPTSPIVKTNSVTLSTGTSVTLNGQITDNKGDNSTVRGFQYGLTTSYGTTTLENGSFAVGTFLTNLTGLVANTTYHYRSYATNSLGTSYSDDATFEIKPFIEQITSGKHYWYAITASADGNKLAAVDYGNGNSGSIYTSTDSGANWTQRTSSNSHKWLSITSSSDGTKLAAAAYPGYIYTSADSGVTWIEQTNSSSCNWNSITSSSDGTILAAVGTNCIYTSEDSGDTWTSRTNSGLNGGNSITSSSDGIKMAATNGLGYIYLSGDSGATWTAQASSGSHSWRAITSSADGKKLAAVDAMGTGNGGYIYTSTDSGVTWTTQTNAGARYWVSIASSSDGTKLTSVVFDNYIYTSVDSGVTWTAQTSVGVRTWYSITSSSDGVKIIAAASDNNIFTNTIPEVPLVNTEDASSVTISSAVLNATIESLNGEYPISKGFEYGLDTSYGNTVVITGTSSERSYSMDVTSLAEETTYHYKSYATNSIGTGFGDDQTFTTDAIDEITSFQEIPNIAAGTVGGATYANSVAVIAALPTSVTAITANGSTPVAVTTWIDTDTYNTAVSGSYTFTAQITLPYGLINSGNYKATAEVILNPGATSGGSGKIPKRSGGGGGSTSTQLEGQKKGMMIPDAIIPTSAPTSITESPILVKASMVNSNLTAEELKIISTKISTISRYLKINMKGSDVSALQSYLNSYGYDCGIVDGIFGNKTKVAVIAFQKFNNLIPDGVVGPKTREMMK